MRDRRAAIRFPVHLPAWVRWRTPSGKTQEVRGETGDISSNGLLVILPAPPKLQTELSCTVSLPTTVAPASAELVCRGHVVRRVHQGKLAGIGATIEEYDLRPATGRV